MTGLTPKNQEKVDSIITSGKFDVIDTDDVEFNYIYQDEQGPWDVNEALDGVASFQAWLIEIKRAAFFEGWAARERWDGWGVPEAMNPYRSTGKENNG